MTELSQKQMHHVIKPEYLLGRIVHLATTIKQGLMRQLFPSIEGID